MAFGPTWRSRPYCPLLELDPMASLPEAAA